IEFLSSVPRECNAVASHASNGIFCSAAVFRRHSLSANRSNKNHGIVIPDQDLKQEHPSCCELWPGRFHLPPSFHSCSRDRPRLPRLRPNGWKPASSAPTTTSSPARSAATS